MNRPKLEISVLKSYELELIWRLLFPAPLTEKTDKLIKCLILPSHVQPAPVACPIPLPTSLSSTPRLSHPEPSSLFHPMNAGSPAHTSLVKERSHSTIHPRHQAPAPVSHRCPFLQTPSLQRHMCLVASFVLSGTTSSTYPLLSHAARYRHIHYCEAGVDRFTLSVPLPSLLFQLVAESYCATYFLPLSNVSAQHTHGMLYA